MINDIMCIYLWDILVSMFIFTTNHYGFTI